MILKIDDKLTKCNFLLHERSIYSNFQSFYFQIKSETFGRFYGMGQLVTRPTGRGVKTDTNPNYQTYGNDNDVDYIQDFNGQYQPSDYEETSIRRSTLPSTGPKVQSTYAGMLFICINLILQATPVKKSGKVLFYVAVSLVVLLALLATGANLFITRPDAPETSKSSTCLLYTSPSPRDGLLSRMPSSA